MPKVARELSAVEVRRLTHPGGRGNALFAVGGVPGLHLQVTPSKARSWILRMTVGARRRDIGLGPYPSVTLAMARDKAREAREKVTSGIDPVEERKAAKAALIAAQRRGLTFKMAVDACLATKLDEFKNEKHRQQWRSTLETYAVPELGMMLVDEITAGDVLRVLAPIWQTKTETASRLRGRIEAVMSWATAAGHRSGDNPARWAGNLKELLPAPSKLAKEDNHPAVALEDAARWFADLRQRDGFGARALEFVVLTAARSGEVRGATWDEIDLDRGMWSVPAARMKSGREHRIPLSPRAIALLEDLPRLQDNPLVFPGARGSQMSDMTLSATMKRIHEAAVKAGGGDEAAGYLDPRSKRPAVPHGLRSTFKDWAVEKTHFPNEMSEIAISHSVGSKVEAAYRRGDMLEKRRQMMVAWASFLEGEEQDNVVHIGFGNA